MTDSSLSRFDLNLFHEATKAKPSENVFVSPFSVAVALAMTLNGARGKTRRAMTEALGLPPRTSLSSINARFENLQTKLKDLGPDLQLNLANALFGNNQVTFKKPFINANKRSYGASVTSLDFMNDAEGCLDVINGWVSEQTRGKIPKILKDIPRGALLYLLNAIYFKGNWEIQFDRQLTKNIQFNLANGKSKEHPLMQRSGDFMYLETADFQAVRLQYRKSLIAMYVFLPKEGQTLADFQNEMTPEKFEEWMLSFRSSKGQLLLPRFKVEYETSLNDILNNLGMGIAFDADKAEFFGMCDAPEGSRVVINEAKHKTFVEVNEEGTEAAAVTSIGMVFATSVRIPIKPFTMVVDRPFFCVIRDDATSANLFLGAIHDPQ